MGKLTIRISERVWERARDPELLFCQLSEYLRRHSMWMWRQAARYRAEDGSWRVGAVRPVMLSMEKDALLKLILRPAAGTGADYLLAELRKARQIEVYEAVTGRSLKGEEFRILRPWEKTTDVVVIIKHRYLQLSRREKQPIMEAWDLLVAGLKQQKIPIQDGDTLFLLTGTPGADPDPLLIEEFSNALTNADAGRVSTDPYETRRAADLVKKYGQKCGH